MISTNQPASSSFAAAPAGMDRRRVPADPPLRDHYRALLQRLGAADQPSQVIGCTSCTRGEGVSTTVANLARQAADDCAEPVLVVDLSPSQQSLQWLGGRRAAKGLSDILLGNAEPGTCLQLGAHPRVGLLGLGTLSERLHAAIEPARVGPLLQTLRNKFRYVLVDLPAAGALDAFCNLPAVFDGVLLVVEAERTRGLVAQHVKQQLEQARIRLLGVVFNKRRDRVPSWLYRRL